MNNKTFADIGFLAIAALVFPYTLSGMFEHKSHADYRNKHSLT